MQKTGILIGLAVLISLVVFKLISNKTTAEKEIKAEQAPIPISVEATTIQLRQFNSSFTYPGTFTAAETTQVLTETDGRMERIVIDKGHAVRKGQLIGVLSNNRISREHHVNQLNYEKAKMDFDRISTLYYERNATGVELETADHALKTAENALKLSEAEVNFLTILAPMNGVVTNKLVNAGDILPLNTPVATIISLKNIEIRVMVPEKDIASVQEGAVVSFTVDAYTGRQFQGIVTAIIPTAGEAHLFPVIVRATNNQHQVMLMAGMSGQVTFNQSGHTTALVIPRTALHGNGETYVWVVGNDMKASRRTIETGKELEDYITVMRGLRAGEIVVTKGQSNITDGLKIDSLNIITHP